MTIVLQEEIHETTQIHLLPPEILATIFMLLRPKYRRRYRVPVEVLLSHVCTRWRNVALGTPFLWTNVNIYSPDSLDCVSNYLERSRDCPINVRFDLYDADRARFHSHSHGVGAQVSPLVDLAIKHVMRWQILVAFTFYKETSISVLSRVKDLAAPLLQHIRIVEGNDEEAHEFPEWSFDARILSLGAPNLISLRTNNIYYLPPLSTITTLHLRIPGEETAMDHRGVFPDLIAACPTLSTLSIQGSVRETWTGNNIVAPSLRSLLFDTGDTFAAGFLTSVSLPNLESLWLDGPHYQIVQGILTSIPQPTFPSLKYLTLETFDYYSSSRFARAFPTITSLHLSYCASFHVSFLEETLRRDDHSRWRDLDTLVFRTTRESHFKKFSKVLDSIVNERYSDGHTPIKTVLVDEDILASLITAASIREKTNLDVLRPDNFDDPWWIMSHSDDGDKL